LRRYQIEMADPPGSSAKRAVEATLLDEESLPRPTLAFRRRAWREFQRALDPLAPPKPLKKARAQPPP
jgi:hypothetical protein